MRVVLDANVLASGFVGRPDRPPAAIVARWAARGFDLISSTDILGEIERTLAKPYFASRTTEPQRRDFLVALRQRAAIVEPTVRIDGAATHAEDDRVLEAAVSARVDYLVTGDRGLQRLGAFDGIPILDPAAFVAVLDAGQR